MKVTVELADGFGACHEEEGGVTGLPQVVEGGRRVVCAVGNFEALPSGYIYCLPSRMLADTGATLSLIDRRFLKREGRCVEPLAPYDDRVSSSSGHRLRVHGWIRLPVRLGSQ
ncbi:hypothetical protein PC128_g25512 [Phytophthora cactorum]|nr:hypothetical protein PC128_g25512 [Phytophthora cactorum]